VLPSRSGAGTAGPLQTIHYAAVKLAALEFIDQMTAQQIAPVAEAIANLCTLLYYQADTGAVAEDEFQDALARIRQAVAS